MQRLLVLLLLQAHVCRHGNGAGYTTNTGTATLTSATITWTVNGTAQTSAALTG